MQYLMKMSLMDVVGGVYNINCIPYEGNEDKVGQITN